MVCVGVRFSIKHRELGNPHPSPTQHEGTEEKMRFKSACK